VRVCVCCLFYHHGRLALDGWLTSRGETTAAGKNSPFQTTATAREDRMPKRRGRRRRRSSLPCRRCHRWRARSAAGVSCPAPGGAPSRPQLAGACAIAGNFFGGFLSFAL
jgi:hypothetical protein